MRKKTGLALVVACSAAVGAGTGRAQDAADQTTRGSLVLAAGDKVHGRLSAGETHALRVHLAKGDAYSFSVNSNKRGDMLLLHLSLLDPSGVEINESARVVHYDNGKRVTVGPFKAASTGTYVIELSAQGRFEGDYWGTSSLRGSRTTLVAIPTAQGQTASVDVSAGANLRLRAKGALASFVVATPGRAQSQTAGNDPLVQSLLAATGLSVSETGTYLFGAPGTKSAVTLQVTKPRWTPKTVEAPKLPADPTLAAQFDWINNAWKQDVAKAFDQAQQIQLTKQAAALPPITAAPVAVDLPDAASGRGARLFLGGDVNSAGTIVNYVTANDAAATGSVTPPSQSAPPPPPVGDPSMSAPDPTSDPSPPTSLFVAGATPGPDSRQSDAGTPTGLHSSPRMPQLTCVSAIGTSMFCLTDTTGGVQVGGWRDTPWTRQQNFYPEDVHDAVLPLGSMAAQSPAAAAVGDPSKDPPMSVRRNFNLLSMAAGCQKKGNVSTVSQYFVDGHPVAAMIASGGDTTITWTVQGSGIVDDHDFTVEGIWTLVMHAGDNPAQRFPCNFSGWERFHADTTTESIVIDSMDLEPVLNRWYRPMGSVVMKLECPEFGIYQSQMNTFVPTPPVDNPNPQSADRFITIFSHIMTVDPTTPDGGYEQDDQYQYTLTCS